MRSVVSLLLAAAGVVPTLVLGAVTVNGRLARAPVDGWGLTPANLTEPSPEFRPCWNFAPTSPRTTCATFDLPLHWTAASSARRVQIHVTRVAPRTAPVVQKQYYFFQGGPASTGAEFFDPSLDRFYGDFEFFLIEARGLAFSSSIGCPPGTVPGLDRRCERHLLQTLGADTLAQYRLSNIARDAAAIMLQLRRPGVPVVAFGVSFGTAWVNRMMQVLPEFQRQARSVWFPEVVILDSAFAPRYAQFQSSETAHDIVAFEVFRRCDGDPACARPFQRLGTTALRALVESFADFSRREGPVYRCMETLSYPLQIGTLRSFISFLAQSVFELVPFLPATLYRFYRCSDADRRALNSAVLREHLKPVDMATVWPGTPLNAQMYMSADFWEQNQTLISYEEHLRVANSSLFLSGFGAHGFQLRSVWPKPPADRHLAGLGSYRKSKLLLLSGEVDVNTPAEWAAQMARDVRREQPGAHVDVVRVRASPHVVFGSRCGLRVTLTYAMSLGETLDAKCAEDQIDFAGDLAGTKAMSTALFGTPHLWE